MKCIDKKFRRLLVLLLVMLFAFTGCKKQESLPVTAYESDAYQHSLECMDFYADALCVSNEEIQLDTFKPQESFHAAALFDMEEKEVCYADHIHKRLEPASTTKLLTLYTALKYGNLTDTVTISSTATSVPSDSSVAGFSTGDQLTFEDLLYSLMLPSGNDSAVAVAEYISGDVDAFVQLMNKEARNLGATNTNFVNPHGYPAPNHYTTAYDLYLIINQCIQNDIFKEIVSSASHTAKVTTADGSEKTMKWQQSNQLVNGSVEVPKGVTVIGGKTGTTDEAGACLVLYSENSASKGFISIIMGAESKSVLYENMTKLIAAIPDL